MVFAVAAAFAQPRPPQDQAALGAYIASDYYAELLTTYVVGYETWIGPCPDPEPLEFAGTFMQERSVPLPGSPDAGALQWVEQVRVTGCSVPYQRLIYVSVADDVPVFHARLLGSTQTSPRLEHEAVQKVIEQEHESAIGRGCPITFPLRILLTVYGESFDTEYGEAWRETWTVLDCNGARDLQLTFRPDHAGATDIAIVPMNSTGAEQ